MVFFLGGGGGFWCLTKGAMSGSSQIPCLSVCEVVYIVGGGEVNESVYWCVYISDLYNLGKLIIQTIKQK